MDHFAGLDVSVKDTSVCIVDDTGKIVREVKVASERVVGGAEEPRLPLQADWIGSRAAVAMALQRSCRGRVTGGLCRDAAHAGSAEGWCSPSPTLLHKAKECRNALLTLWGNVHREIAHFRANVSAMGRLSWHVFTHTFDYIALGILVACMLLAGARALYKAR